MDNWQQVIGNNNMTAGRDLKLSITPRTPNEEAIHNLQVQAYTLYSEYEVKKSELRNIKDHRYSKPFITAWAITVAVLTVGLTEYLKSSQVGVGLGSVLFLVYMTVVFYPPLSNGLDQEKSNEQRKLINKEIQQLSVKCNSIAEQIKHLS